MQINLDDELSHINCINRCVNQGYFEAECEEICQTGTNVDCVWKNLRGSSQTRLKST